MGAICSFEPSRTGLTFCACSEKQRTHTTDLESLAGHRSQQTMIIRDGSPSLDLSDSSSFNFLREENKKLKNKLLEMQEQLTETGNTNESLKQEVTTLQNELPPIPTPRARSIVELDHRGIHTRMILHSRAQSVPVACLSDLTDLSRFVYNQYDTKHILLSGDESASESDLIIEHDRESSVDADEQLEIDRAREKEIAIQLFHEEEKAMKSAMSHMKRMSISLPVAHLSKSWDDIGETTSDVQSKPAMLQSKTLPVSPNLFCSENEELWNQNALYARKKEMEAAMTSLLEYNKNTLDKATDNQ